jgi:hypothetical protein
MLAIQLQARPSECGPAYIKGRRTTPGPATLDATLSKRQQATLTLSSSHIHQLHIFPYLQYS